MDKTNLIYKRILSPYLLISVVTFALFSYFFLDKPVALFMENYRNDTLNIFFEGITLLGKGSYWLITIFFAGIFAYFVKNKSLQFRCLHIITSLISAGLICDLFKFLLGRARPNALFHEDFYGFYFLQKEYLFNSFPSGHATTIAAVMMSLALFKPKYSWLFASIAFAVVLSRLVLTAHYISDITIGMYLGSVVAVLTEQVLVKFINRSAIKPKNISYEKG